MNALKAKWQQFQSHKRLKKLWEDYKKAAQLE